MSWSNTYIGLPWADRGRDRAGCDCWGLACLIYREERGIVLPDYLGAYVSADEQAEIAGLIAGAAVSPLWRHVTVARTFDLAVFRAGRWQSHIGIVVQPGQMIHMAAEDRARVERYDAGAWRHRLTGFYRPVEGAFEGGVK